MIQQSAEGESMAGLVLWLPVQPGPPPGCAFGWGAYLGQLHDGTPALGSPSSSGWEGGSGMHSFGSNTGMGSSWGVQCHPCVCPRHGFAIQCTGEETFQMGFQGGGTPCLWFIAFVDTQPLDLYHLKAAERMRLLILIELIASIEINSMWASKHCLHIITLSVEHTAEFELRLQNMLEGRTYVSRGFGETTTHEIAKAAGMCFV